MDKISKYRKAALRALILRQRDKEEGDRLYGEGVITRRQAATEAAEKKNTDNLETQKPKNKETLEEQEQMDVDENKDNNEDKKSTSDDAGSEHSQAETDQPVESENESENSNDPFNKETLVAENNQLKVYVIKTHFKKNGKFNYQDHQYVMHFKKKVQTPILLSEVLDILEKAFFAVLANIKSFFKDDTKNLVYLTLLQENLLNPIRTSPYVLQSNDTKDMVNHLMSQYNRFVNSNQTLHLLENSFTVFIKVLSDAHVNHPDHKRKAVPISQTVGKKSSSNVFLPGGRISIPVSYPGNINIFQNKCLLSSVALGYLQITNNVLFEKTKKSFYLRATKVNKIEAGNLLQLMINDLCNGSGISDIGPHDLVNTLPKLADYYKIQIHVILTMDGPSPSLLSFPSGVNFINNLPAHFIHSITQLSLYCSCEFN